MIPAEVPAAITGQTRLSSFPLLFAESYGSGESAGHFRFIIGPLCILLSIAVGGLLVINYIHSHDPFTTSRLLLQPTANVLP